MVLICVNGWRDLSSPKPTLVRKEDNEQFVREALRKANQEDHGLGSLLSDSPSLFQACDDVH